jgi:maleate isomerase
MSSGYGDRARIGHLYPSGGLCDFEIQAMAPAGVQFVTTRMPFRRTGIEDDRRMADDLEFHALLVADAEVDLIAFNCTAASIATGSEEIRRRVEAATGLGCVTTIDAVLFALRALDISRPALMTPYPDDVVSMERRFLSAQGVTVRGIAGWPCSTPVEQARVLPEEWFARATDMDLKEADGLLISCAGVQVSSVIERIESQIGKPVITSNQALLWHVLQTLEIELPVEGFGRLLSGSSG